MKIYNIIVLLFMVGVIKAQSVEGTWVSVDDNTGEKKSEITVEIKDGKLYGTISKLLLKPADTICDNCPGDLKDTPVVGLQIINGLSKSGDTWKKGKILDPESGKYYKCLVVLEEDNKLKVRGYVGIPTLGRTQYWERKL